MAGKDASGVYKRLARMRTVVSSARIWLPKVACLYALLLGSTAVFGQTTRPPATAPTANQRTQPGRQTNMPIMAVVNGQQISREVLGNECMRRYGKEVLDNLVYRQIIEQACQARGVTITAKDIETEIKFIAEKFGLTTDRWLSALESERDIDPDQYRQDIIWPTLALRKLASAQLTVTDDEFRQAFESEYGPSVKARVIVVTSRERAEWLRKSAIADPDSFARLAKEHSEDRATASAYGVIPPIRKHVGDANVEQAAFALKEGGISEILQVGNQYLIIKCEKQLDRTYVSSEHMPAIERQLRQRIVDHKIRIQSADVFKSLKEQAQVVKVLGNAQNQARYPGIAAIINNQQITLAQVTADCLARHGDEVLEGEINRQLLLQELGRRQMTVGEQDIDLEVSRAADAYGYNRPDGSPDIEAWLKNVTDGDQTTVELYVRDAVWPSVALKKLVGSQVQVTQEDMQKGFESNYGERVEVLAIVLGSHRQAQTVWETARGNPTDDFFGQLAKQYSIEPTSRSNFGKVPPIRRHSGQPLVEKEAFRLKAGELSGIVAVGDQYIIMRCLGRTDPVVTEFALVKDELYKDLHEKKLRIAMAKEFDRLSTTAQIDNFLAGTSQTGQRNTRPPARPTASPASYVAPANGSPSTIRR